MITQVHEEKYMGIEIVIHRAVNVIGENGLETRFPWAAYYASEKPILVGVDAKSLRYAVQQAHAAIEKWAEEAMS